MAELTKAYSVWVVQKDGEGNAVEVLLQKAVVARSPDAAKAVALTQYTLPEGTDHSRLGFHVAEVTVT